MAAGSGAAAVAHLQDATVKADLQPQPPSTAPSGRPKGSQGREASSSEMWQSIFLGIGAGSVAKEDCNKCAALASMFQLVTSEVVSVCLSSGLDEGKVRNALKENMFKSASNPQDGATAEGGSNAAPQASRDSYGSETAGERKPSKTAEAGAWGSESGGGLDRMQSEKGSACKASKVKMADSDNGRGSMRGSVSTRATPSMCFAKKPSHKDVKDKKYDSRKSVAAGSGLMCKHMDGEPEQLYDIGPMVGQGSFGTVRKARHRQTGQIHAVKSVPKALDVHNTLWDEIGIMKIMDHPHIMRLYYTFEDETYIHMASEMCAGGELYDILEVTGFFPERVAATLMRQILGAVNYLHSSKHIAHRDLKPENFLVLKQVEAESLQLKLIDFGTARNFDTPMLTKVCTAHYVAPEVLKRGEVPYTERVDVWSCGVILYMLLCGFMPFHHEDDREILKIVKKGKYTFTPVTVWSLISASAKDLISKMMCLKADLRVTATQAYNHEWVQLQEGGEDFSLLPDDDIVKSMRQFLTNNRLKRVALQIIARQIDDDGIMKLRRVFQSIDKDQSGTLTIQEMDEALIALEVTESSRVEMSAIMRSIDADGSGELEYTEFLAAMLTQDQYLQEDVCKGAFCLLDVDADGTLSQGDLKALLQASSTAAEASAKPRGPRDSVSGQVMLSQAAMEEIEQIMAEVDEDGDGGVSFEEFWTLMKEDGPNIKSAAVSLRWGRKGKERHMTVDFGDMELDEEDILSNSGE